MFVKNVRNLIDENLKQTDAFYSLAKSLYFYEADN